MIWGRGGDNGRSVGVINDEWCFGFVEGGSVGVFLRYFDGNFVWAGVTSGR